MHSGVHVVLKTVTPGWRLNNPGSPGLRSEADFGGGEAWNMYANSLPILLVMLMVGTLSVVAEEVM